MTKPLRSITAVLLVLIANFCYSQRPAISYSTPQIYNYQVPISPLVPSNTGGAVPVSTPVTLGSGFSNLTSVAVDAAGNVYFTANGSNAVEKIPAGGGSAVILGYGFSTPTGVAVDAAGNVYVADFGNSAIKKIAAVGGNVTFVASGLFQPYGIAVDGQGNLFITERGANVVKRIASSGGSPTVYATGFNTPTGIAVDAGGNVYVTDRGNNLIKKILTNGGIVTVSPGNGNPNGVAVDADGNVYFADTNNKSIIKIPSFGGSPISVGSGFSSPAGVAVSPGGDIYVDDNRNTAIKEILSGGYLINPALPQGLSFDNETGIITGTPTVVSPATNYVVTTRNSAGSSAFTVNIKVSPPPKPNLSYNSPQVYPGRVAISPLAPVNSGGAVPAGGFAISPALPTGLAFDINTGIITGMPITASPATNYTVTATNLGGSGQAIINITITQLPKPTLSYPGPQVYLAYRPLNPPLAPQSTGVAAATGYFTDVVASGLSNLRNLTVDDTGNIYVVRVSPDIIQKIPADGSAPVTLASGLNGPTGITVDGTGNVYFAESGTNSVKKIPAGGGPVVTVASGFNFPMGIAINKAGELLVAEKSTGKVQYVDPGSNTPAYAIGGFSQLSNITMYNDYFFYYTDAVNSTIYKLLGATNYTANTTAIGHGSGNTNGVAVDTYGNVYYADASEGSIKEIPAGGGSPVSVGSGLSSPYGLAIDKKGILYVTDINSNSVKKITPNGGYYIAPNVSPGLVFDTATGIINGTPTKITAPINYNITGFNAGGSTTAVANVKISYDRTLTSLNIVQGTLNPAFNPGVFTYNGSVADTARTIKFNATAFTPNSIISVNNAPLYYVHPLPGGLNVFTVTVRAPDSSKQIYTVNVIRGGTGLSTDATLSTLTYSPAITKTPGTGTDYKDYVATVANTFTYITVVPVTHQANAQVKVNGVAVASGATSAHIPLAIGANVINTVITAQDGVTTKTYKLTITRLPSTDATLATLTYTPAITKTPGTGTDYKDYVATVSNTFTSIAVIPVAHDPAAKIKVNGITVASGATSAQIPLSIGANVVNTVITAPDGVTTKTYKLTVTRKPSTDATLATLTYTPAITKTTVTGADYKDYVAIVANTFKSISVIPVVNDVAATVKVNGVAVASGATSAQIPLNIGANVITTVVIAPDGITTKTYKLAITRQPSTDATLSTLSFTPAISKTTVSGPDYKDYVATVANSFMSISVTPVVHDATATVKVNGLTVAPGATSAAIPLVVGSNIINTVITAQDGVTTKTYSLNITRKAVGMMMRYDPKELPIATDGITVHQNVSPNGDGNSDVLVIDGIATHPDNKLQIMSRSGMLVYEAKGYDNATRVFDGHSSTNGKLQQAGTYFYSLEYKDGEEVKHKTGFIVLKY